MYFKNAYWLDEFGKKVEHLQLHKNILRSMNIALCIFTLFILLLPPFYICTDMFKDSSAVLLSVMGEVGLFVLILGIIWFKQVVKGDIETTCARLQKALYYKSVPPTPYEASPETVELYQKLTGNK